MRIVGINQRADQNQSNSARMAYMEDLEDFDWFNYKCTAPEKPFVPEFIYIAGEKISAEERKLRMLRQLSSACLACSMCELGLKRAEKNQVRRDPHVLSNMKISKFMVVGQKPEWDELKVRKPLAGAAGGKFNTEVSKYGLSRDDFYICNIIRCWSGDTQPEDIHAEKCEPFLQMEINVLKPKVIVALGAVVFSRLCPGETFDNSLKKLVLSKYGVKVFPIYHPMDFATYQEAFKDQIRVMCGLIKAIRKNGS